MILRGLYLVTPDYYGADFFDIAEMSLRNGVDMLQYRDKTNDFNTRLKAGKRLKEIAYHSDVPFLINDDLKLALEIEADGLHIGRGDANYDTCRAQMPEGIIGVSTYDDVDLGVRMQKNGADYVSFGPFYATESKDDAEVYEKRILEGVRERINIPIFAIGGINFHNVTTLMDYGLSGVAVISAVYSSLDPANSTKELKHVISRYF